MPQAPSGLDSSSETRKPSSSTLSCMRVMSWVKSGRPASMTVLLNTTGTSVKSVSSISEEWGAENMKSCVNKRYNLKNTYQEPTQHQEDT